MHVWRIYCIYTDRHMVNPYTYWMSNALTHLHAWNIFRMHDSLNIRIFYNWIWHYDSCSRNQNDYISINNNFLMNKH